MYRFKIFLLSLFLLFNTPRILSQIKHPAASQQVSAGLSIPVGEFAETHLPGLTLQYDWSKNRIGYAALSKKKQLGFCASGAINAYIGKKTNTSGYDFRFGNYYHARLLAGVLYRPAPRYAAILSAGPAVGYYKQTFDAGYSVQVSVTCYLNEKTGITPGIHLMKHALAASLWSASVQFTRVF